MSFVDRIKNRVSNFRRKQREKRRVETVRLEQRNKINKELKKEKIRFDRAKKENFNNSFVGKAVSGLKKLSADRPKGSVRVTDQADKAFESGFFGSKNNFESGALKGFNSKKEKKDKFDDLF